MSHTLTVETKFLDPAAILAAAREMGLEVPVHGTAALYEGIFTTAGATKHTGLIVKLPEWKHPVIINTQTGVAVYDNYNGKWGSQEHLSRFTQLYNVHKATLFAKSKGLMVQRTTQQNGNIKLQLTGAM